MTRNLPSLDAIRYFEVAARLQSFTKAGKELFLSQSAVSQKIIQLEDHLGYRLFFRRPRGLVLTPEGEILYKSAQAAISQLKNTVRSLASQTLNGSLTVIASPSAASKWLMPKLPDFFKTYPEINLSIAADITIADFETGQHGFKDAGIDIAICHRLIKSDEFHQDFLMDDYCYPVCSPQLTNLERLRTPADLNYFPILYDAYPKMDFGADWQPWLESVGLDRIDGVNRHVFNRLDLMIQAAILGQGIALGRHSLVDEDIRTGKLIQLFPGIQVTSYYLVTIKELRQNPRLLAFINWIKGRCNQTKPA
jgi:LysR family glycine cleavage system transcriptional activator